MITSANHLDLSGVDHMQLLLKTTAITSAHQISDSKDLFLTGSATASHPACIILWR